MVSKQKVLFVCALNSFRSQIAGSLLNKIAAKYFIDYSAGSHQGRVYTDVISAMKNIKSDISNHISNWIFGYLDTCLLYTSPSPRDLARSRMPSSA